MRVGDLLEWLAACAFVAVGYLAHGLLPALAVTGVCLFYFAQCHAKTEFPRPRLPKISRLRNLRPRFGRRGDA